MPDGDIFDQAAAKMAKTTPPASTGDVFDQAAAQMAKTAPVAPTAAPTGPATSMHADTRGILQKMNDWYMRQGSTYEGTLASAGKTPREHVQEATQGAMAASVPLIAGGLAAAPVATALGLGGSYAGGKIGAKVGGYAGAKLGAPEMGEDVGGLVGTAVGGGAGAKLGEIPTAGTSRAASIGARERLIAKLQNQGKAVTEHVGEVANRFKSVSDANAQIVSQAVAEKFPEGHPALDKASIAEPIQAKLGELVKTPEALPPALAKLTASPLEQASVFQGAGQAARGAGKGMNAAELLNNPNLNPAMRARIQSVIGEEARPEMQPQGAGGGNTWSWEELKQIKSDLGQQLWGKGRGNYTGQVKAAGAAAYRELDTHLGQAAQDAGTADQFAAYKQMHKQYMDDFVRGPLNKVIGADNPTDVANAVQGKRAQVVRDALDRYKDYGINKDEVLKRAKGIESGIPYTKPIKLSAWDYRLLGSSALGGIHPAGYAVGPVIEGIRIGVPLAERLARAGLSTKVKPIKAAK